MSKHKIEKQNCIMCNCKVNSSFYDQSKYRPICSKACYTKYIDGLPARYKKTRFHDEITKINEPKYEYYKRGILTLANYKL